MVKKLVYNGALITYCKLVKYIETNGALLAENKLNFVSNGKILLFTFAFPHCVYANSFLKETPYNVLLSINFKISSIETMPVDAPTAIIQCVPTALPNLAERSKSQP